MVKEKIELRFSNQGYCGSGYLLYGNAKTVVDPGQLDAFMNSVCGCENI